MTPAPGEKLQYLRGAGEVGRALLLRSFGDTGLGPIAEWPGALHDALRITLYSDFPHIVYWGPEFHTFWNDAARHLFKAQHPQTLGLPLSQVQPDVMRTLRPLLQQVMESGHAVICHDLRLVYRREDSAQEYYEIFSYSPLLHPSGAVQGIIAPILDTTSRVIGERRMSLLTDLASSTRGARTLSQYCESFQACLGRHRLDLPLVALYVEARHDAQPGRVEPGSAVADAGAAGNAQAPSPRLAASSPPGLPWPRRLADGRASAEIVAAAVSAEPIVVLPVSAALPSPPTEPWGAAPTQLAVMPVLEPGTGRRVASVLFGLNPYRLLDAGFEDFLRLLVAQVSQGLAESLALEREADRALADIARLTRLSTLGELAASIAHEVNQPLAAMLIDAHTAQRWLAASPPNLDEASRATDRIVRSGEHAGSLLARTRRFLQPTPSERAAVDVPSIAQESLDIIASQARRHGVQLRARLEGDLPKLVVDRTQIHQVMLNLLLNAIEAMTPLDGEDDMDPEAGTAREVWLEVGRCASPPGIRVAVRDRGQGIDPAAAARLFDPFYTTKPGGLGFGLTISRSIVEAHGGLIWAEPATPCGAIFAFVLPIDGTAP